MMEFETTLTQSAAELVPHFVLRKLSDCERMREALRSADSATFERLVKETRHTADFFGFRTIAEIAASLDHASTHAPIHTLELLISALEAQLIAIREQL